MEKDTRFKIREGKICRTRILKMLEEKNLTLEELKEQHQQKRIHLFKGHIKQMSGMIVDERDKEALTEENQRPPSSYHGIIKMTIYREGCTLEELAKRNLNKNVKIQIHKMIHEQEKDVQLCVQIEEQVRGKNGCRAEN